MIKNKFKFLITGAMSILIAGIFSFGIANASDPAIYITPNNLNKQVGDNFVLVATVDTADLKVCAVEGKLQLDKLSCQSIIVGDGIMAQKSPSCADPSFLLGIPNCTTVNKTLFTITVGALSAGKATVGFTGVDVIGEGMSLSTASVGGNYNLSAVSVVKPVVSPVKPVVAPAENCVCEDWSEWENNSKDSCGQGGCDSNQLLQIRERECNPISCGIEVENRCVADSSCPSINDSQTASIVDAAGSVGYIGWLIAGLILLILIIVIPYYLKKRK